MVYSTKTGGSLQQPFAAERFVHMLNSALRQPQNSVLFSCLHDDSDRDDAAEFLAAYDYEPDDHTALPFYLNFFEDGFVLQIGGGGGGGGRYEDIFANERQAVEQIIAALTMLLNGQLAMTWTTRHGRWHAAETLLFTDGKPQSPYVLSTVADYKNPLTKRSGTGYDIALLRNHLEIPTVAVPRDFFLCDYTPKGTIYSKGRVIKPGQLTPLTQKDYWFVMEQLADAASGKKPHETDWMFYYRSWEFWALMVVVLGLYGGAFLLGIIPSLYGYGHVVVFVLLSVFYRLSVFQLLTTKEQLKAEQPNHPWIRFDAWFQNKQAMAAFTAYGALSFWNLSQKIIDTPRSATNVYAVSQHHSWVLAGPVLIATGIISSWNLRGKALYIPGILITLGNLVMGTAMVVLSGDYNNVKDTYGFIAYFIAIASCILLPTFMLYTYKLQWESKIPDKPRDIWEAVAVVLKHSVTILNLIGAVFLAIAAYRMHTYLQPSMLNGISPTSYVIACGSSAAVVGALSLFVIIARRAHAVLYWVNAIIVLILFGAAGLAMTDDINKLNGLTWFFLFTGLFVPLIIGSLYTFSREYLEQKHLGSRNF